jgi:hypothetical protein
MARFLGSLSLIACVFLTSTTPAKAGEPAPAPRALYPRFDLTYLPTLGSQGVIGVRPAEIAQYVTKEEAKRATHLVVGLLFDLLGKQDLDAAEFPTFDNLEQCVLCLQMQITVPKGDDPGAFFVGGVTPGMMRTVRPFDWDGMLRTWFPKIATINYAGRSYVKIPIKFPAGLPMPPKDTDGLVAFIPDDRTIVMAPETEIRNLLDRLKAKKPALKAPAGWSEVDRDLIAFALDNKKEPLVSGKFPADYSGGKEVEAIAGAVRTLAVGLTVGDRTRLRFVATASDASGADTAADALRSLFSIAAAKLSDVRDPDRLELFGAALLKSATFNRDGRSVTGSLSADGNVIKMFLEVLLGSV